MTIVGWKMKFPFVFLVGVNVGYLLGIIFARKLMVEIDYLFQNLQIFACSKGTHFEKNCQNFPRRGGVRRLSELYA